MSTLAAVKPYDQVLDGQKHYRTLLQATARPGSIGQLDDVALDVPPPMNHATALICLALMSGDSSFHMDQGESSPRDFIRRETSAREAEPAHGDFIIVAAAHRLDAIRQAKSGSLLYPEQGATVIFQVAAISPAPIEGGLRLLLTGPGIETETEVYLLGASGQLFDVLRERNAEFPMGIDVFFTCDSLSAGPCVLALPRTTQVRWEQI
jgi:alpha-D-ribose 1-methylphosphonate 5-triphosphate synthase subunit PhnH